MKLGTLTAAAATSLLLLAACNSNGVDRTGTRDNIVKGFSSQGATVDKACVDKVLDQYSDDELKSIDAKLNKSDYTGTAGVFYDAIRACVTAPPTTT